MEALEEKVMSFFVENPSEDYVADHLDAYERLLVHAASKYHQLYSRSKLCNVYQVYGNFDIPYDRFINVEIVF